MFHVLGRNPIKKTSGTLTIKGFDGIIRYVASGKMEVYRFMTKEPLTEVGAIVVKEMLDKDTKMKLVKAEVADTIYEYKDILARAMGGRQAEELIYGEAGISTGASSDLRSATNIARNMIVELGMGKDLRDQVFHEEEGGMFFDKMTHDRPYSEKTAEKIDVEVAALLKESVERAAIVLKANKKALEDLTKALLEKETIEEEEVKEILKNTKLPKEVKLHE